MSDRRFTFRPATLADAAELASIYRAAAHELAAPYYTPEQIQAWASWPDDTAAFESHLQHGIALVSIVADRIAAFAQLDPVDHVALLYTNPRFARQGHASAIVEHLESVARSRGVAQLCTTASLLSRPLFAKYGFEFTEIEHTHFKGVAFEHYKMEKRLSVSR